MQSRWKKVESGSWGGEQKLTSGMLVYKQHRGYQTSGSVLKPVFFTGPCVVDTFLIHAETVF